MFETTLQQRTFISEREERDIHRQRIHQLFELLCERTEDDPALRTSVMGYLGKIVHDEIAIAQSLCHEINYRNVLNGITPQRPDTHRAYRIDASR